MNTQTSRTPRTDALLAKRSGLITQNADLQNLARTLENALADKADMLDAKESLAELYEGHVATLRTALRHIDGIANFMAATGKDREQWEQVRAHCAALAKVPS